jgi:PHD/YefM family antitoxin component YafN of YafNO toxin-antitoxin module
LSIENNRKSSAVKSRENIVKSGEPVFLTKNGYGSMVVLSLERYSELTDDIEMKLNKADSIATESNVRYTHEEVFARLKGGIK